MQNTTGIEQIPYLELTNHIHYTQRQFSRPSQHVVFQIRQ